MSILAILLFLWPQHLLVNDLIDGVTRAYARMADFSASFEQISTDPSNQKQVQRGLLYLSRNGKKMRFDYKMPEIKSYYSDGKTFTAYVPAAKQAVQAPVGKAVDERLRIFQVLVGGPEWREQYPRAEEPRDPPLEQGHRLVRMLPSRKDLPVVLLEVDPKTSLIHRFELQYEDGEHTEFRFSDLRTAKLDPTMFVFKAPAGVEVIQER